MNSLTVLSSQEITPDRSLTPLGNNVSIDFSRLVNKSYLHSLESVHRVHCANYVNKNIIKKQILLSRKNKH